MNKIKMRKKLTEVNLSPAVRFTTDCVFKMVFDDSSCDYLPLRDLAGAAIGKEFKNVVMMNAEERRTSLYDKNIRYDIKALLDDRVILDLEIQNYGAPEEIYWRSIYYASRALATQTIKSYKYSTLKPVYCIFLMSFNYFKKEDQWFYKSADYNEISQNDVLTESIVRLMIEIDKAHLFSNIPVEELTKLQQWIITLQLEDFEKIEKIARINPAIEEAVNRLIRINEDERQRAIAESRLKFQQDLESFTAYAKEEGKAQAQEEVALEMLKNGISDEMVLTCSKINEETLLELKKQI